MLGPPSVGRPLVQPTGRAVRCPRLLEELCERSDLVVLDMDQLFVPAHAWRGSVHEFHAIIPRLFDPAPRGRVRPIPSLRAAFGAVL